MTERVHGEEASSSAGARKESSDSEMRSAGDAHGTDKQVARASIHTRRLARPDGIVLSMWNAARFLSVVHPEIIQCVECCDIAGVCSTAVEPSLIGVPPFLLADTLVSAIKASVRSWPYLHEENGIVRGVLVMKLTLRGRSVYVLEIQRRPSVEDDGSKRGRPVEQPYCGLAVEFEDDRELVKWLPNFLLELRHEKGIIYKTLNAAPVIGNARWFRHKRASSDRVAFESALTNALKLLGIVISRNTSCVDSV